MPKGEDEKKSVNIDELSEEDKARLIYECDEIRPFLDANGISAEEALHFSNLESIAN